MVCAVIFRVFTVLQVHNYDVSLFGNLKLACLLCDLKG